MRILVFITSFYSTHIPDKFIKFNEFKNILKRQNSNKRLYCTEYSVEHMIH